MALKEDADVSELRTRTMKKLKGLVDKSGVAYRMWVRNEIPYEIYRDIKKQAIGEYISDLMFGDA